MRLKSSINTNGIAAIFNLAVLAWTLLAVSPTATVAQNEVRPAVMSTGSSSKGVKAQASRPSGQLVLDRNAPIPSPEPELILEGPSSFEPSRPIASNFLQETLPTAAASPNEGVDYSTASPYKLRAVEPTPKSTLRTIPVAARSQFEADLQQSTGSKPSAPKVSRIPLPKAPVQSESPTAPKQVTNPPSQPTTQFDEVRQFTDSVNSATPVTPPKMELPSSETQLPELPSLSLPTPVSGPRPLPLPSDSPAPLVSSFPSDGVSASPASLPSALPPISSSSDARASEDLPSLGNALPNLSDSKQSLGNSTEAPRLSELSQSRPPARVKPLNSQPSNGNSTVNRSTASSSKMRPLQTGAERLRMQTPRIQVSLNGPQDLSVGVPQTYSILVRNDDQINLGGLILRLDIPPGVIAQAQPASHGTGEIEQAADGTTLLTWSFENLAGGQEANLPLRVVAEAPRNFSVAMEWTLLPIAGSTGIDVLTPQLELALEGPSEVSFSEPNIFRLHVRNRGNADANDVAVKLAAEHFGSSSTQIGRIAAGEQQTIDVELVFNEPGNITIAAEASAAGNIAAASQVGVRVRQSLLEVALDAPARAFHSAEVPYILSVKNAGDAIAKNAKAVVTLPADCTAYSLPPQARIENGDIVWNIDQVRPGQLAELPFSLSFAREGDNRVSVHCTASSGVPAQCLAITNVKAVTDLKLLVTDPIAPAPVHGEVAYELTLVNRGSKAAEQVSVVAMFSNDIEPIRAEGHRSQIVTGQVRFQPITRIEPGQTITLKVFAEAATAGTHRFRAEVRTNEADVKLVQEQSTEFMESIRRTASSPSNIIR